MTPLATYSLALGIVCVGLFSGLMFALVVLLQPKWNLESAAEYITDIQPFLKVSKGNRFVTLTLFMGLFAPIPAFLSVNGAENSIVGTLILIGLIVFGIGALGVTVALNLPTYAALMRLDVQAISPTWTALRRRFYHLNLIRFLMSVTAFALLVAALAV
jgi:uncharacterized membrane protein